jgi:predicted RND superfamily exporter protein
MTTFARWLVRYPWLVVISHLLVTALLGICAARIRIEGSLSSVLPADDPAVAYYEQVRAIFGSDDVGVIGVRADNLFAASTLERSHVTDAVSRVPASSAC